MLDYYLKVSYKNEVITKRRYEVISNYLLEIIRMILSWNSEKSK